MPLRNSYESALTNLYGIRHFGSANSAISAEPYTTGTFYIWIQIPSRVMNYINNTSLINDIASAQKALATFCTGVTPPGGTLNKIEYTGVGGVKWAVPGSIDYGTSITLKFIEMQSTVIQDIIGGWVRLIRDNRTGLSNLETNQYLQQNYSGVMLYWTTAPNGTDIQYYCAYDGVFPLKDPGDLYTSDVETVDKQDIEIEFNVNRPIRDNWVFGKCAQKSVEFKNTALAMPGRLEFTK
jgi:hypothetical protein